MSNPELKKRLLLMAVFLVLLFGSLFGFDLFKKVQMGKAFAAYQPPAVTVTAVLVETGEIPRTLEAIGSIQAIQQVQLAAEVDGRITALRFKPGSSVLAGQPLLQLNDAPEQGDLQRLRAQAKLARINLDRSQQLLKLAVSQSELDAQQATLAEVEGEIARTEALIAQKLIRAPFAGQIGVQSVHLGQYVQRGETLLTLTDLKSLYLNFTLPEQQHSQVHVGQTVEFVVDALPQQKFTAKVIAIEPQIGMDSRAIKVQAQLENQKNLLAPGMFARAALQLPAEKNVVSIPETAVDYSIHGDSVYVLKKQKAAQGEQWIATRALVRTDGRTGDRVIVRSGVRAGDRVVTAGQLRLHDGAVVQIVSNDTLNVDRQRGRVE